MSFDQLLLIGVAIGLILVGLTFFIGRNDKRPAGEGGDPEETSSHSEASASHTTAHDATEDAVARLAETVGALQRLAELKNHELARDNATREEARTGWQPLASPEPSNEEPGTHPDPASTSEASLPPVVTEVSQVRLDTSTKMHMDSAAKLRLSVGQAFTPAAPVARRDLFAGREEQLESLVDVVFEQGQHAIVYGERGVGKTSLVSILSLVFADQDNKLPIRINCDASDDFDSIWRKVLDELEMAMDARGSDVPRARAAIGRTLGRDKLGPGDATRLLKQVAPDAEAIVVIDEFDTVEDDQVPRLFADTIKMLSDQLVPSTVILLGVADTLDELLTEHGSVSRALVHVHMPRMSVDELKDIVKRGLDLLTMDIEDDALDVIARLSQGFPHFTHLLAQAAARAAIDEQRPLVTIDDVASAARQVAGRIEAWIEDAYEIAATRANEANYPQVLLAAALSGSDERGYFAPSDVKGPMAQIAGKPPTVANLTKQLNALSAAGRGSVLLRTGTDRRYRYRFADPQMGPYVVMRSMKDGLIDPTILRELGRDQAPAPA